jgi:hypothetical protein
MSFDRHDVVEAAASYIQWCVNNGRLKPLERALPKVSDDAAECRVFEAAVWDLVRRFRDGDRLTPHRSGDAYELMRQPFLAFFTNGLPSPLTAEDIARLREDFPDLVGPTTIIGDGMPSTWLTTIRAMLSGLRSLKFGRRLNLAAVDLTVRSIGAISEARVRRPAVRAMKAVVHAPAARGMVKQAIDSEVRRASTSSIAIDAADLQQARKNDIDDETVRFVGKCVRAGKILETKNVVMTSAFDSDVIRHSMPHWVLTRAFQLRQGRDLPGIDEATRARFIDLWKASES